MIRSSEPVGTNLDSILQVTGQSKSTGGFRRVLGAVVGGVGNIVMPGFGGLIGGAIGGAISGGVLGAAAPVMGSEVTQFLQLQRQIQLESEAIQTASVVLKTRHDAIMSCLQNMNR